MAIFLLLVVIAIICFAIFPGKDHHARHMRLIEEWRIDNGLILTPKNIENKRDSNAIKLRLWIGEALAIDSDGFPVHIKKEYKQAYISGNPRDLPNEVQSQWISGIPLQTLSSENGKKGGRFYLKRNQKTGKYYRYYY